MLDQSSARDRGRMALGGGPGPGADQPLTGALRASMSVDAYEIQLINIRRRLAGAPGAGAQGRPVLAGDAADDGRRRARLRAPARRDGAGRRTRRSRRRVLLPPDRGEIGYVLGSSLPGEGCTEADVLAATEYVVPSLELIDSRITDWRIKLADTIADNASSAGVILGRGPPDPGRAQGRGRRPREHRCRAVRGEPRSPAATPARSSATRPPASPGWPGRWPISG